MKFNFLSQAMAETVGSVMGNHVGRGRYLKESYLSKELVLGGLHYRNLFTPFTTLLRV